MNRIVVILLMFILCNRVFAQITPTEQDACVGKIYKYSVKGISGMAYHWLPQNGVIVGDTAKDIVSINWGSSVGKRSLKVYGEIDGCFTNYLELTVNLNEGESFDLEDDVIICEGQTHTFEVENSTNYKEIKWHDGSYSDSYAASNSMKVWANAVDKNGCEMSDTGSLIVRNKPYINLGPDTMLCGNETLVLNPLSPIYDGYRYFWNGVERDEPSLLIGKGIAKYTLLVEDPYGCTSIDTILISKCTNVFDRDRISIAIIPDGVKIQNRTWNINGLSEDYPNAVVKVFDRGGRLVYVSEKGYPENWDGRHYESKKMLPMASYYYIIFLNNKENDKIPGTVNIIR